MSDGLIDVRLLHASELERVDARLPLSRLDTRQTYLVAWDGDDPVGHAHLAWQGTKLGLPEVQDVFVLPERRREGIATQLTLAAEKEARARGFDAISLSVSLAKGEVRRLYESLGYEDAGLEPQRLLGTILMRGAPFDVDDTVLYLRKNLAMRGEDGLLPAMRALYQGDKEGAARLLPDDAQLTAAEAAAFGRTARLRELLDAGPERVNEPSPDGFTPLHLALFGGSADAVSLLLERGADLEALSTASFAKVRPLGTAAFVRSVPLVTLLLDAGADPNGPGEGGATPLDTAVQNDDRQLIDLLTARGAQKRVGD
jgi:ribosomal protein S18 acetylase RimI-like enzyme